MDKKRNITVCVAWPYANNNLHIGHVSSLLAGDLLARYHRMKGDNVLMVGGTDSHGTKPSIRAKQEGVTPKEIVDRYHENFKETFKKFNFSFDMYNITYDPYHKEKVKEFTRKFYDNGYLYENRLIRTFCPTCNKFMADTELEIICPNCGKTTKADSCDCGHVPSEKDLEGAKCLICGGKTVQKENRVLVFKLTAFKDQLKKLVDDHENIWRPNSINETRKYLADLQDRDFSRDLDWGIEIPIAGFEDKKIWVWWEALLGYVTDTMKVCEQRGLDWRDYWSNDSKTDKRIYMCHAKDNIPFHSLFLPAMLMATKDNFFIPDIMVSAEYLTFNNEKISKSKGFDMSALSYANEFNTDSLRYYFFAYGPEKKDADFTSELYKNVHNTEVVNKLGNLVNRVLKFKGLTRIPVGKIDENVRQKVKEVFEKSSELIEHIEFKKYAECVMNLVADTNKYYDEQKPWAQAKEDEAAFANTMATCAYVIANLSILMEPIMPESCAKLREILGITEFEFKPVDVALGRELGEIQPLFSRF